MTRTKPLTIAARLFALMGLFLWGLAAAYVVAFAFTGSMVTASSWVLLTIAIILAGLVTNVLLLKRPDASPSKLLAAASLLLTAVFVGFFAYVSTLS